MFAKKKMRLIIILSVVFLMFSCGNKITKGKLEKITLNGNTQGTYYSITMFAEGDAKTYATGIDSLLNLMDITASVYNDSSIISRINRNDSTVVINDLLIKLFTRSLEISAETNGAFDITVGALVRAWGFAREKSSEPDQKMVDSLLELTGYKKVRLTNNSIIKDNANIRLDFNAIAQGATVDLIAEYFKSMGVENFLIDVGGEVQASGKKPDGSDWVIGIEKPENTISERVVQQKVVIGNRSIATSGSYRKFIVQDGIVYSHTIDPSTGYPTHSQLLSVSVIANNTTDADAYATAFMVMGIDLSMEFLKKHPELQAFFISAGAGESFDIQHTEGFKQYMQ